MQGNVFSFYLQINTECNYQTFLPGQVYKPSLHFYIFYWIWSGCWNAKNKEYKNKNSETQWLVQKILKMEKCNATSSTTVWPFQNTMKHSNISQN